MPGSWWNHSCLVRLQLLDRQLLPHASPFRNIHPLERSALLWLRDFIPLWISSKPLRHGNWHLTTEVRRYQYESMPHIWGVQDDWKLFKQKSTAIFPSTWMEPLHYSCDLDGFDPPNFERFCVGVMGIMMLSGPKLWVSSVGWVVICTCVYHCVARDVPSYPNHHLFELSPVFFKFTCINGDLLCRGLVCTKHHISFENQLLCGQIQPIGGGCH